MIEFSDEIWKEIPNSLHFAISNYGRVKRLSYKKSHNINKTFFQSKEYHIVLSNNNSKKYWRVTIWYLDGTRKTESVHRLVAKMFVPNPNNLPQVNHIDGDKNNNHFSNLEWCTNNQNMTHRYTVLKNFSGKSGEGCNFTKLKEEDMFEIKRLVEMGVKKRVIAGKFGVSPTTITEFTNGRSWRHLNLFPPRAKKSDKYFHIRYVPTTQETEETSKE